MKKIAFLMASVAIVVLLSSCQRVSPNYAGVLMENYGKQGKEDFKIVSGRVSTWELGTEHLMIASRGLTKEILYKQFIDKWDGHTPLYRTFPEMIKLEK